MQRVWDNVLPGFDSGYNGLDGSESTRWKRISGKGVRKTVKQARKLTALFIHQQKLSTAGVSENWICENTHYIEQVAEAVEEDLSNMRRLPILSERFGGEPRIYVIMTSMIIRSNGNINISSIEEAISEYMQKRELCMDEINCCMAMARMALLELLRLISIQSMEEIWARRKAEELAPKLLRGIRPGHISTINRMAGKYHEAYIEKLVSALRGQSDQQLAMEAEKRISQILGLDLNEAAAAYHTHCAEMGVAAANAISSLRELDGADFRESLKRLSPAYGILMHDEVFRQMDETSQDYYLSAVVKLSKKSGYNESYITNQAMKFCRDKSGVERHVGYYLVGSGKKRFAHSLGIYVRSAAEDRRLRKRVYFSILFSIGLGLTAALDYVLISNRAFIGEIIGCTLMGIVLFFVIAQDVANRIASLFKPAFLPKMGYTKLPEQYGTVLCVPIVAFSGKDVEDAADSLEVRYHTFNDAQAYILLCDLFETNEEHKDIDDEIVENGKRAAERLARKLNANIIFAYRKREFAKRDNIWRGFDRKRGALRELNLALRGRGNKLQVSGGHIPVGARFVITMDADTYMAPGECIRLACAMAHPLNRDDGYGILQPRMGTAAKSRTNSRIARLYAAEGVDFYSQAVSEVYMDISGEGNFFGKGIYDVDRFSKSVDEVLLPGAVLSHDLLEGCLAHCGLATDIQAVDAFPQHYTSWAKREHRWIRGDWQLAPFIFGNPKGRDGKRIRLAALTRWKMFDNLRRSMVPFCATQMFALGVTFGSLPWLVYALAAFSPYWFGLVFDTLASLVRVISRGFNAVIQETKSIKKRANRNLAGFVLCAYEASIGLDAAIRSLYRIIFSHKKLLQWVTAEQAEKGDAVNLAGYFRMMLIPLLLNAAVLIITIIVDPPRLVLAVPVCAVWMLSPIYAYWLDRGALYKELKQEEKEYFTRLARDTWGFFIRYANEDNGYLAPDNAQIVPTRPEVRRTSPTNMGFSVLACISAYHFDFIDKEEMVKRVESAIKSMEGMEKWEGHLYNWYDLGSMSPTKPKYISTVDSGNLAACLLTAAAKLRLLCEDELAERADALAYGMDFSKLYNETRMLMSIGFDCTQQQLTKSYYDLYASEARIASLFAIAAGQAPAKHWRVPGRPSARMGSRNLTLSWSGTAFEYLMPSLFITPHFGTFERRTCTSAIKAQIVYAKDKRTPFGISESGYSSFDPEGYYQYRAFGIPMLSVRSIPRDEAVVSPYSTALIAMFHPSKALRNFRVLQEQGARGRYGFYEAIDYSGVEKGSVVRSFMAHHQGMALTALDNVVNDGSIRKLFESVLRIRAVLPLAGHMDSNLPAKRRRNNPERDRLIIRTPRLAARQKPGMKPSAALFAGGGYSMYITQNGSGGAVVDKQQIYKSAGDNCTERGGVYVYINSNGHNVSPCMLPTRPKGLLSCSFEQHKATHRLKNGKLSTRMETCVEPSSGIEIRLITIENGGQKAADVDVCAAFEPVVTKKQDHDAHPAYSNLFLHTSIKDGVLMCERRPRYIQAQRQRVFMGLFGDGELEYETDKLRFLGRNRGYGEPAALRNGLSGSLGPVINPIMALRRRLSIPAGKKASFCIVIGMADGEHQAVENAKAFENILAAKRAFSAAESFAQAQAKYFDLDGKEVFQAFEKASDLLYSAQHCQSGRAARLKLYEYGISGDLPVSMLPVQSEQDIHRLNMEMKQKALLARRGLEYELLIADMCGNAYFNSVRQKLQEALSTHRGYMGDTARNHVHSVMMDERQKKELESCIYTAMEDMRVSPRKLDIPVNGYEEPELPKVEMASAYGGFAEDGEEYVIKLEKGTDTPAPWANIIANEGFGFICTERGAGYTYSENAREYKLTPWSSDPVENPYGEALFIKNEISGAVFCPQGGPIRPKSHIVRHGLGYSAYEATEDGVYAKTTLYADATLPVKVIRLQLKNKSRDRKKLSLTYIADLVLSSHNTAQRGRIAAHYDADNSVVLAHNGFEQGFSHLTAFLGASEEGIEYELCRERIYGSCGKMDAPLCMAGELSNQTCEVSGGGVGLRMHIQLSPGEKKEVCFLIGAAERAEIPGILQKYRSREAAQRCLDEVKAMWARRLGAVEISTPVRSMDIMVNKWLPYQVYSSRLFSRTGFYQAGGAFGFRDQLQDTISLLAYDPLLCRRQIIRSASHQFTDGDVQHWWHEPTKGVRTKITDDMLFLPYAVCEYIKVTGDASILDEAAPFLKPEEIPAGKEDIYYEAQSEGMASIYEHCLRAIWRGSTEGVHGLPLIGSGDWNDGMNRAGREGRGESVWLGFFLFHVLSNFKRICGDRQDAASIERIDEILARLQHALEQCFDGDRFVRAFLDDGTPLGKAGCPEYEYDLITPAWAAITKAIPHETARQGLLTAIEHLYDDDAGILRLLWPPFDKWEKDVGYIQGYLPGVRENGGQYSHGAIWGLCGLCEIGESGMAAKIFSDINPVEKSTDEKKMEVYKCEPYVFPADIYSVGGNAGRSGWTWYTGSAGWAIRFVLEWLLGIHIIEGKPEVSPSLPDGWDGYTVRIKTEAGSWYIQVHRDSNGSQEVVVSEKDAQATRIAKETAQ